MFETEPLAPKALVRESGDHVVGALGGLGLGTVKRPAQAVGWVAGGEHAKLVTAVDELSGESARRAGSRPPDMSRSRA